jgi:hypothetical protein
LVDSQIIEITVLLQPGLRKILGFPVRMDYLLGWLLMLVLLSGLVNQALDVAGIRERLGMDLTTNIQRVQHGSG